MDKSGSDYGIIKTYMPAIVIIPCRYASTRFPGKPLQSLLGKPLIQHVYERAGNAKKINGIFVATDDQEIFEAVKGFGGQAVMTSAAHKSGTDRITEALLKIEKTDENAKVADIIVNVQGDEPMIMPEMVDDVVELMNDIRASIGTLARKIDKSDDITDPNVVKVVFDKDSFALYFSRSPIPFHRDISWRDGVKLSNLSKFNMFKHVGIYAYRRESLLKFTSLPNSPLEEAEKLEQLRALENSFKIKVKITPYESIGVDTPEDLERVKKCLSISS